MSTVFKGIYFEGRQILKPGAYGVVKADSFVPNRPGPQNTIGILGTAMGGVPKVVTTINDPVTARTMLRGGNMLSCIELMYDPSPELPGAGEIKLYRLNAAVRATLALKDAGASTVLTVSAEDYGVWTNQLRLKVEAGSVSGKKITINDVLNQDVFEIGDNLGHAMTVSYVGIKFAAQLVITKTGDAATQLQVQTKVTGAGDPWVTEATLDLTSDSLNALGEVVAFLDGLADYTASIVGAATLPSSELDAVAGQDIKTAPYTSSANIGAIVHWVNTQSLLATASRQAGAANVPANIAYTFLSGGSEGAAVTNTDWQIAIDAFLTENIHYLFVATSDATVHAMALDHCVFASDLKQRKERRCFLGGAANETVEQTVTRAQALADKRAQLVYPGIKRRNLVTGNVDTLSPMFSAAAACGMKAGGRPEISLTFKNIRASGLEKTLTLTEIERLLDRGVTPLESVQEDGVFRIVQDLTTYLVDANVIWRKGFGVDIADYLNGQVRNAVSRFVGKVGDRSTVTSILNAANDRLKQEVRSAKNQNGVLTDGTTDTGGIEPAYKNLQAVFDGFDLVAITYEAHPVGEVAYITITASLTPTKIALSQ